MNKIFISCIIPIYNSQKYIRKTFEYLINQELKNFEVIFVDDGSNDDSVKIIKQLIINDSRFKLIENKVNKGAAYSRNQGLEIAKGEYVIFLDSDDEYYSDMFSETYKLAIEHNADLVVFDRDVIEYDKLGNSNLIKGISSKNIKIINKNNFKISYLSLFKYVPWNKLVRRKMLIEKNIKFQEVPVNNDIFYSGSVILFSDKIVYSKKSYIKYNLNREGSLTFKRRKGDNYALLAYEKLYNLCKINNFYNNGKDYLNFILGHIKKELLSLYKNEIYEARAYYKWFYEQSSWWEILNDGLRKNNISNDNLEFVYMILTKKIDMIVLEEKIKNNYSSRVDIQMEGCISNFEIIEISDNNAISKWSKYNKSFSITSIGECLDIKVKALTDGVLYINLLAKDVSDKNGKVPVWIDYTNFSINDKIEILNNIPAWHEKPLSYSYQVKVGEIVSLHVEWEPHIDTRTVIEPQIEDDSNKIQELEIANKALNNKIDVLKKTIKILSN